MAKQAKGMKSITNLAFETTYGQAPTGGTWYRQPINKNALTGKQNLITTNTITGRRDTVEPGIGQMDASGQLELPMDVRNVGNILKGIFGAPTTSAGTKEGTYKHVFKVGDEIPSLTVEKGFPDIGLFFQYTGTKLNKFSLTAQVGNNETTYTVDTMASNETEAKNTAAASPTSLKLMRFNNVNAAVKEGGTALATCRKMQVDINNNLDGDTYCLNGSSIRPSINEGLAEVTGSIETLFEDDTQLQKAMNSTETSLELAFTRDDFSLTFSIPEVILERTTPGISGPKGITQSLNYRGYYADDAGNSIITVTLINDVEKY
jgi:hypothetical protein|nr:MAG TPA: Tail tube protein [Caudovirales sp. ctNII2]